MLASVVSIPEPDPDPDPDPVLPPFWPISGPLGGKGGNSVNPMLSMSSILGTDWVVKSWPSSVETCAFSRIFPALSKATRKVSIVSALTFVAVSSLGLIVVRLNTLISSPKESVDINCPCIGLCV